MILSRTMRDSDYKELGPNLDFVKHVASKVGGLHPAQHYHRHWEYALLDCVIRSVLGTLRGCKIADVGCGVGLTTPLCLAHGASLSYMTEIWTEGDWSYWILDSVERAKAAFGGQYLFANADITKERLEETYALVCCVSTVEHIADEVSAFENLAAGVSPGGVLFLTMDFANDEGPHAYDYMRARIYVRDRMLGLAARGRALGLALVGGEDWCPTERLVNDYGFASLVMQR